MTWVYKNLPEPTRTNKTQSDQGTVANPIKKFLVKFTSEIQGLNLQVENLLINYEVVLLVACDSPMNEL